MSSEYTSNQKTSTLSLNVSQQSLQMNVSRYSLEMLTSPLATDSVQRALNISVALPHQPGNKTLHPTQSSMPPHQTMSTVISSQQMDMEVTVLPLPASRPPMSLYGERSHIM